MGIGPLVSVIIPTHNRAALLPRAIRSVLGQTYQHLECIVVDDASSDDTSEVVRQFDDDRLVYLRHQANRGGSASRNTGIAAAQGSLIAFLDDDDEWLPRKLEEQVALMESAPLDVGVVHCLHYTVTEERNPAQNGGAPAFTGEVYSRLLQGECPSSTSLCLVRRQCFEVCGGFDETLPSFQDYDLWLRVSQSYCFACVEQPLAILHRHGGSRISRDMEPRKAGLDRILSKWGPEIRRHHGAAGYRQLKRRFLVPIHVNAARQALRDGRPGMATGHVLQAIWLQPTRLRKNGSLVLELSQGTQLARRMCAQ